jgi:hypothetical protein
MPESTTRNSLDAYTPAEVAHLAHVIETNIDLSGPFRELARTVVEFHRNANIADPGSNHGVESTLRQHAGDNFI